MNFYFFHAVFVTNWMLGRLHSLKVRWNGFNLEFYMLSIGGKVSLHGHQLFINFLLHMSLANVIPLLASLTCSY